MMHQTSTRPEAGFDYAPHAVRPELAATVRPAVVIAGVAFVAMLPVTLLVPVLKELVGDRYQVGPMWSHAFMSVNMIGAVLAAPWLTRLAALRGQMKRVAALGLAAEAVLLALMSLAPSATILLVLRFFEGAAHILTISTLMAMASSWSRSATRGRTMSIIGAAMMFGTTCGTRLGGVVWAYMPNLVFVTSAAIALIAGILTLALAQEASAAASPRRRPGSLLMLVRERPSLWTAFAYAFIDRFCVGVIISTFVLFLANVHGLDPSMRSGLLFLFMLPFAVLLFPAGLLVDRIGRVWPIAVGSILFGVAFASYGFLSLSALHAAMVVSGILSAIMFAPNLALCADLSPVEERGAAFVGFNIAGSLGFLAGPLIGGLLLRQLASGWPIEQAYAVTLLATGATQIACGLITLPLLLRLRRAGITR